MAHDAQPTPPPEGDGLTDSLIGLFREIDALFSAASRSQGLTPQQAQLLCFAQHMQPSFGELARLLHCDKTNVTGLADRLERRGLITREPDPHDRRLSRVHLTADGAALTAAFQQVVDSSLAGRFTGWTAEQRASLLPLLRAATTTLRG
ncbi:MarR family winged helix-turn-helix transcriptional regulator [Streptomyces sp. NRRL F-5123]|uniref:MarR family winged helix-turn-helix transcriptional regulator n=1 Tax=Streptomyces sp. NRRL F-5123 TaxID=1463856 RepID=UPI0006949BB9|nr:MarR family transcriptional regulator [Streptomyces sp. NRRL F-5123]